MRRLVFDVSSLARWAGPPGGIARVEQELLTAALADRPDILPAVFDPDSGRYRRIRDEWRDIILGGEGAVVLSDGPALARRGWRALVPRPGDVLFALERWRLTTRRPGLARAIDRAERLAARLRRHSVQLTTPTGARFAYVPKELALGGPVDLGPSDTVLTVGYDWLRKSPAQVRRLKAETGVRYVVTCYDLIPILYPDFYAPAEVEGFRRFWREMLTIADAVLAISGRTADDLAAWSEGEDLPLPRVTTVPLASSIGAPGAAAEAELPAGLKRGRYVLMVGTIEPRKGHQLLLDVWHELMARGVPQRLGFALVFVGRRGWKTDALQRSIAAAAGPHLVALGPVWDARLEALYRDCAFCVMPSVYEGYGLPIVEAFAHGKAVIASDGGSLPEVVDGRSPCLDPGDTESWRTLIERWMAEPEARRPWEERIRASFRRLDWPRVADRIWRAALAVDGGERGSSEPGSPVEPR